MVALAGLLAARRLFGLTAAAGVAALVAYTWVVIWPASGLPARVAVDAPPRYLLWLREAAGREYRTFGIYPDYSSLGEIQDVEVVGPLATNAWVSFVDLVSSPAVAKLHRIGSTFALDSKNEPTIWYDLTADYPRARPLLDWAGVRYLVLDKTVFDGRRRADHLALLAPSSGLRVAYDDADVTILESPTARTKAFFTSRVQEGSATTMLARLQGDPRAIQGAIIVEADLGEVASQARDGPTVAVPLVEYRPNDLRASFEAPAPGVFVVTDSPFPGWQATVNGRPADVVQVNGLVRGVVVPAAGPTEVTMSYRPASFTNGVAVAGAVGVLLLALAAWELACRRGRPAVPCTRAADAR
jgi:hypothetical protein